MLAGAGRAAGTLVKAALQNASYISQHVEGNLLAADQEIEKLYLLLGPGKITYADVAEAITAQSRYSVFELVDVLLAGNPQRAIKIVAGLKAEGVVPVVLNWALARDIRLLAQAAADPRSADLLLKRSGVWQSRVSLFKSCLGRHPQRLFQQMLKRCGYIDAASKGMIDCNVWDEIESLCVRLAGSSRSVSRR
jgi:DNA polymerase-3 subunit delta